MNIGYSNASTETVFANALTNNTFDLQQTEKSIRSTVENSFKYLKGLQRSYISAYRFNLSESDMFVGYGDKICVTIDKDFIEFDKRKEYRRSSFYNKFVNIDDIRNNPNIFFYVPFVIIDGKSIFSYEVKSSLDGTTTFKFNHIAHTRLYLSKKHSVQILFLRNEKFVKLTTNYYSLENNNWNLPRSLTNLDIETGSNVLMFFKDSKENDGTNIFYTKVGDNNSLPIDVDNNVLYEYIKSHKTIEIYLYSSENLHEISECKQIYTRIDNNIKSSIFTISDSSSEVYNMPIDTHNIIVIKKNKLTGEMTYENDRNIILHYPNIYEIISEDIDPDIYEYKVFYFYKNVYGYLKYRNHFRYIHRYFCRKFNSSLDEAITTLLYSQDVDNKLRQYFLSIFDYEDADYIYNHGDFFTTHKPYNFDYKVTKMVEFIDKDPLVLKDYAEEVCNEFTSYFLNVESIDLSGRMRDNTFNEAEKEFDKKEFDESHYVFMFRNDTEESLHLRFFIDGLLCTEFVSFRVKHMEYIYIPCRYINQNSHIEVERFYEYKYTKDIKFNSITDFVDVSFDGQEFINPTLFDIFFIDSNGTKIPRTKLGIYMKFDKNLFDVSDVIDNDIYGLLLNNNMYQDSDSGDFYIDIDEILSHDGMSITLDDEIVNVSDRLPIAYMSLDKLRIKTKSEDYVNTDITLVINKIPSMNYHTTKSGGVVNLLLFGKDFKWNTSNRYVRTFLNGRLISSTYDIYDIPNRGITYSSKFILKENDTLAVDVSTFAYELEYSLDVVPEDFLVSFEGHLSKPFSTKYYDIYLNGRKLSDVNVQMITADKIKLFNVKSRHNLQIFKRDRDIEYYGFTRKMTIPLDDILNSDLLTDEDKESIIDDIINDNHPDETIIDGEDIEDVEIREEASEEFLHYYRFYLDIIIPRGVTKPNDFFIDKEHIMNRYSAVYEKYSNKKDRIVMRPSINFDANVTLMIGKKHE